MPILALKFVTQEGVPIYSKHAIATPSSWCEIEINSGCLMCL